MRPSVAFWGGFSAPRATATANTAFVSLIRPNPGGGTSQTGIRAGGYSHVTKVCYTTGGTAHPIYIMRPLNYTTFTADAAAGQAVVNIAANPGAWATTGVYKYGDLNGATPSVANNLLAANDYVVYQTADGLYYADTVASIATLAVTLTTNVPTGGVKSGGLLYFFGVATDTDPGSGFPHPTTTIAASQTRDISWSADMGVVHGLHAGDPLLFYSGNPTAAGILEFLTGFYGQN
jgi:hypothetical protein